MWVCLHTKKELKIILYYELDGAPSGCRASHGKLLRTEKEALSRLNTCTTYSQRFAAIFSCGFLKRKL
jgi:hypothetical protein